MKIESKTTLLIGNGLNNTLDDGISWSELLKKIAESHNVEYNGNLPMPLEFECIMNQILRTYPNPSMDVYVEIKREIASSIQKLKLEENAVHYSIPEIPTNAIMTSNYDYFLEKVYREEYVYNGGEKSKYLFDATSKEKGVAFYHIHGVLGNPKSICLGYEHYMGVVENLRKEINTKEKNVAGKMQICQALRDPKKLKGHWYEKFYTDDIHIIGLGLTESEVDIWWLITHRASILNSNYYGIKEKLTNKITYYDIIDDEKNVDMNERNKIHYMLRNSNVDVKILKIRKDCDDYRDGYHKIFEEIKTQINAK